MYVVTPRQSHKYINMRRRSALVAMELWWKRQIDQKSITVVKSAEDEGANQLPHNFNSDVTFQLPKPAQVVEARTGDPVYLVLKCEFAVEQNPEVTDNSAIAHLHLF